MLSGSYLVLIYYSCLYRQLRRVRISTLHNETEKFSLLNSNAYKGAFLCLVTYSHLPKGYGLGLAIARKAVILQGGTIQARNRAQGGLRVTMTLPLHDPS